MILFPVTIIHMYDLQAFRSQARHFMHAILITLTHIDKKRTLLRRFHHIRDNDKFKYIKMYHDKTKQERGNQKSAMKKQRGRKLQISRGNTCTESGVHHGRENKKDKEKPINTPRMTDGKTNVNKK